MTARNSARVLCLIIVLVVIDGIGCTYWMVAVDTIGQRIFVLVVCLAILLLLWTAIGEVVNRTTIGASDFAEHKK